jgi:hypothetical protein
LAEFTLTANRLEYTTSTSKISVFIIFKKMK